MASQIKFFKKNIIDLSNDSAAITVTDAVASNNGQSFVDYIRNRNNFSAWLTTGSTDAANTTLEVDWGQGRDVDSILLIGHNFKAFTIQYWNGSIWTDFSTPIAQTVNADSTTLFSFDQVETTKIKIIITGTQVVNADKELYQLIVTEKIANGAFEGWPVIKNPIHDLNLKSTKMLSGKTNIVESTGAFKVDMEVSNWRNANDLALVENLYFRREPFLVWLGGGDESQFSYAALGYRKMDIYYMRPSNSYEPEFVKGLYQAGLKIAIKLVESI